MNQPAVSNGESIFNLILLSMAVLFTESVFQFNLSLSNFPEIQKMDHRGEGGRRGAPNSPQMPSDEFSATVNQHCVTSVNKAASA